MRKLLDGSEGTVTVLLSLILVPTLLWAGLLTDYVRIRSAEQLMSGAAELALNASLSRYRGRLKREFGLFALADCDDREGEIRRYLTGTLDPRASVYNGRYGAGRLTDSSLSLPSPGSFYKFHGISVTVEESDALADPEILLGQILSFQQYRVPARGIGLLGGMLDELQNRSEEEDISSALAEAERKIAHLNNTYLSLHRDLTAYAAYHMRGLPQFEENLHSGFTKVDSLFVNVWSQLRRLEGLPAGSEAKGAAEDALADAVYDIRRTAADLLHQSEMETEAAGEQVLLTAEITEKINKAVSLSSALAADTERIGELLSAGGCSPAYEDAVRAKLKAYSDFIPEGDLRSLLPFLQHNEMVFNRNLHWLRTLRYRTADSSISLRGLSDLSPGAFMDGQSAPVKLSSHMRCELSEGPDAELVHPEAWDCPAWDSLQIRYGQISESEALSGMLKRIGDLLGREVDDQTAETVIPVEIYETLPSQNSSLSSESESDPGPGSPASLIRALGDAGLALRDRLFLEEYATGLFSCRTDTAGDQTMLGTAMDSGGHYLFGSEMEYLLIGSDSAVLNTSLSYAAVFSIRFMLNYHYALTDRELMETVRALALLGPGGGIAQPVLEAVLLTAIVTAETALDLRTLLDCGRVTFMKSKETWACGPAALTAFLTGKGSLPDSGAPPSRESFAPTYRDYLRALLFLPRREKLLLRLMDLIELNMNCRIRGSAESLLPEDMVFRLQYAETVLKVRAESCFERLFEGPGFGDAGRISVEVTGGY